MTTSTPAVAVYAKVIPSDEGHRLVELIGQWERHKDIEDERGARIPYLPRVMQPHSDP
jgi:hypothetical protein